MAAAGAPGEVDPGAFFAPLPRPGAPRAEGGEERGVTAADYADRPSSSATRGDEERLEVDRARWVEQGWNQRTVFEWADKTGELPRAPEAGGAKPSPWSAQLRYFSRQRRVAEDTSERWGFLFTGKQARRPAQPQGSREYLCASFEAYWVAYLKGGQLPAPAGEEPGWVAEPDTLQHQEKPLRLPPNRREPPLHDYELIREGRPCRLYYDLEYSRGANPGADGPGMVRRVVEITGEVLQERFKISLKDGQVLELDSSSPTKFSRHLIFHLEGPAGEEVAFKTNQDAGAVARAVVEKSAEMALGQPPEAGIFVAKDPGGKCVHPIVDLGVYTRNRVFRMYGFSKEGKDECLLPTRRFMGAQLPVCPRRTFCLETFRASLVTFVGSQFRPLQCEDAKTVGAPLHRLASGAPGPRVPPDGGIKRKGPDPPEKVLAFMGSKAAELGRTAGGAEGWVRSFVSLSPRAVVFNLSGTRFCHRIGREHKSNGVYFMADLEQGFWWQKCYDPDCSGFSTAAQAFPPEVWQSPVPQSLGPVGGTVAPVGGEGEPPTECGDELLLSAMEEFEEDVALMEAIEGQEAGALPRGK